MDFIENCRHNYQNAWKNPNYIITAVINDLEKRDYNKAESNMWLLYRDGYWYDVEIETDHEMFKQLREAVKLKDQEMIREEILKIIKHLRHLEVDEIAEIMKDHSSMYVDCIVE